jgi:hypothetical protein
MLVDNAGFSRTRWPNSRYTNVPSGGCNIGFYRLRSPNEICSDIIKEF